MSWAGSALAHRFWRKWLLCGCVLLASLDAVKSSPNFNPQDPLAFFTCTADLMLRNSTAKWCAQDFQDFTNNFGAQTTSAFSLTNIPVYINGVFVYSPAVNRLLQLAANVYDATTASPYPSVFRPLFSNNGLGDVFITGFTNIVPFADGFADYQLAPPTDIATFAGKPGIILNLATNICGVPWIIGAKKGLPNFNEFSMENVLSVTRRLQLTRVTNAYPIIPSITGTNQMYLMSLSSSIGVELWNSYTNNYPGSISIGIYENATLSITNDDLHAVNPLRSAIFSTNIIIPVTTWPGTAPWYAGNPNSASFIFTSFTGPTLTNSVYRSPYATGATVPAGLTAPCFVATNYFYLTPPGTLLFESPSLNGFHFPQLGVVLTNRLQCFVLDVTNGLYHVIDYVHFAGPNGSFNVNSNLADGSTTNNNFDNNYSGVWNTNYVPGSVAPAGLTYGILNQLALSKSGATPPGQDGKWQADPEAVPLGGSFVSQVNFYRAFFLPGSKYGSVINPQLSMVAPYAPTRVIVQYLTWQANDPLVHYLASDVDYSLTPNTTTTPLPGVNYYNAGQAFSPLTNLNLGSLNDHYMPWGGNPHIDAEGRLYQFDTNIYNLAERDPLMTASDNWDFPTNSFSTFNWIGRVHRGTPWQSIYLKADDILASNNLAAWQTWTGNGNSVDASNEAPAQDWHLASLLTSLLNTNPVGPIISVNNPDPNVWLFLLDGLTAWTNLQSAGLYSIVIWSNSPQAAIIANAIQAMRASFASRSFSDVGDVLATEQLTEQSPFLDWSDPVQQTSGISDEAYEIIPSQLLSLLRMDSTGSVVWSNGQLVVNFTGWNLHLYAIQVSSDLVNWVSLSTNYPVNGTFSYTNSVAPTTSPQFYRTLWLQ
jgi:hypothetical protein